MLAASSIVSSLERPTLLRVEHLTAGVDWVRAVETMTGAGVTTFVEVGPGKVLTGLIKRIAPDAEVIPADDPASTDRLLELAASAA